MNRLEPREDARLNRERVIEAAREVFRERGIAAEMREIAERSGLAVGTIYRNYPTKDDLILALMDDASASFAAGVTSDDINPLEGLERLLVRSMETVQKYGWLIDAYLGRQLALRLREEMERKSVEFDFQGRCKVLLSRAIDAGEVREDVDIETVASLIAGVASTWISQPRLETHTAEQLAEATMKTLLAGIRPIRDGTP